MHDAAISLLSSESVARQILWAYDTSSMEKSLASSPAANPGVMVRYAGDILPLDLCTQIVEASVSVALIKGLLSYVLSPAREASL